MPMRPHWLTVENPPKFHFLGLGVGITAYSEEEVRKLFAEAFGPGFKVKDVRTIHTMDEIDQGHVRPNMGNHLVRGIWFPLGFD
jgi:hypothetical protein